MRVLVAAVGRLKDPQEREMVMRYQKRFDQMGRSLGLGPLEISEIVEARAVTAVARKFDEAARLLKLSSSAGLIVALDVEGKPLSSETFAQLLARHRDAGIKSAAFLIGGPDGHGVDVLSGADLRFSLGAMTLPHGLARVVLVEQFYRAATILAGHPYHRA